MYGSQEMVVICDEIVHMIKRILAGISVTDETLAVDLIRKVGQGGDYLQQDHTFKFFRKELFYPKLFRRQTLEQWQDSGGDMIHQVAHNRVKEILASAQPVDLLPGADSELERALRNAIQLADKRDPRSA
jgi:trimethylamine--corrinoid protein Co-methyltransferase